MKDNAKFISAGFLDWTCSIQILNEESLKMVRYLKLTPIILDSFKNLKNEKYFSMYAFEIINDIFEALPYIPRWFVEDKLVFFDEEFEKEADVLKKCEYERTKNIDLECELRSIKIGELNKKINKIMVKRLCLFKRHKINKINGKKSVLEVEIDALLRDKNYGELEFDKSIAFLKRKYRDKKVKFVNFCEEKNANFNETNKSDYIPLKDGFASKFDGAKGCFIIRNKEFNVSYPFKTTNLLEDLKTLFDSKSYKPLHDDFISLYNSSTLKDKSNIFDVKILYCQSNKEIEECYKKLKED